MGGATGDELRRVTSLFVDVVGSTALAEQLAPGEVKAIVGECVTRLARAAEEYGGTIQAYLGDGLCVYFGVPWTREDDAERACRSAFRMIEVATLFGEEVARTWGVEGFAIRIGINTGLTSVGPVGAASPGTVALGDATNVAARLQSAAAENSILIGAETATRVADRFELEAIGELMVKGRAQPVRAWRLLGRSRLVPRSPGGPLVGRDAELADVRQALEDLARRGRGQIVVVTGPPGIGKTRLVQEARSHADDMLWLQGACLSYGGVTCWPFVEILRGWLRVDDQDDDVVVRMKTRAGLGGVLGDGSRELVPLFDRLLGVPVQPRDEERVTKPARDLWRAVEGAIVSWVERLADASPVVIAIEDVQWADRPTVALGARLLELAERCPLCVLITLRLDPGTSGSQLRIAALGDHPHRARSVDLAPLSEHDAATLVELSVPGDLDRSTRAQIVDLAEGNPLFLEELSSFAAAAGQLDRRRTWTVTLPGEPALPASIENLLVSRIDALPEGAKSAVRAAAVIGPRFRLSVLQELLEDDDIETELTVLLRAEIISEVAVWPNREYVFKHRLAQEAALASLSEARRRQLYVRLAPIAEREFGISQPEHLEMLAHYYAHGQDTSRAVELLERAAGRAATLGDDHHAAELWQRAARIALELRNAEVQKRIADQLASLGPRWAD